MNLSIVSAPEASAFLISLGTIGHVLIKSSSPGHCEPLGSLCLSSRTESTRCRLIVPICFSKLQREREREREREKREREREASEREIAIATIVVVTLTLGKGVQNEANLQVCIYFVKSVVLGRLHLLPPALNLQEQAYIHQIRVGLVSVSICHEVIQFRETVHLNQVFLRPSELLASPNQSVDAGCQKLDGSQAGLFGLLLTCLHRTGRC